MFLKISSRDIKLKVINIRINNNIINCEYAQSQEEREKGLMFRNNLPLNNGMLFDTFGRYKPTFHMRNTLIPLESVFISNSYKIIDIVPMLPLDSSSVYTCTKNIPVKWVLELNRGYCNKHNIKLDDYVNIL